MQKASEKNGSTLRKKRMSDENERLSTSKTFSKVSKNSPSPEKPKKVLIKQDMKVNLAKIDTLTKLKGNKTHGVSQKENDIVKDQIDKKPPNTKKPQSSTTSKAVKTRTKTSVKTNTSTKKSSVNKNVVSNEGEKKSVLKEPKAENISAKCKPTPTENSDKIPSNESSKIPTHELSDSEEIKSNMDKDNKDFEKQDFRSDSPRIDSEDSRINLLQQQPKQDKAFYEKEESLQYFEMGANKKVDNDSSPGEEIISESVEWNCLSDVSEHMSGTIDDESNNNKKQKKPKPIMKSLNSRKPQLKKKKKNSSEDKRDTYSSNNSDSSSVKSPDKLKNDRFKMPLTVNKRNRVNFFLSEKWRVKLPVTKFLN